MGLWKTAERNVCSQQIAANAEGKQGCANAGRSSGPPKQPTCALNPQYFCLLDPCANSLLPKFVVGVEFRVCVSSRASQNNISPSNLWVNLRFPISSVTAWLVGLKKELYTICFTRSFCPLDTFSSFWPDKAYLSSGYEPIIQSWIEIYGQPFVPAHTQSPCDSLNCLLRWGKRRRKKEGKNPLMHLRYNNLLAVKIFEINFCNYRFASCSGV